MERLINCDTGKLCKSIKSAHDALYLRFEFPKTEFVVGRIYCNIDKAHIRSQRVIPYADEFDVMIPRIIGVNSPDYCDVGRITMFGIELLSKNFQCNIEGHWKDYTFELLTPEIFDSTWSD